MNLRGLGVSPGTAHGPVVLVHHEELALPADESAEQNPEEAHREVARALEGVATSMDRRAGALPEGEAREVLAATAMIARDPAIMDEVRSQLEAGHGKTWALAAAIEHFAKILDGLGGYMAERVSDLRDVHRRAHARLHGLPEPGMPLLESPAVLVADDLAPADTAELNASLVLAIVTEQGGPTSHTAILAAQRGIPAVVRCPGIMHSGATTLGIDGSTGEVFVDPDEASTAALDGKDRRRVELQRATSGEGRTRDGHRVELLANIGALDDAIEAGRADVEGVGLLRSEFLFLGRPVAPSFEEQVATYKSLFDAVGGRKVVIRTLDAGADKPLQFATLGQETNPALGIRGLRLQRSLPGMLETQLQAIAQSRAESGSEVWVMAPMVSTSVEAEWFTELAHSHDLPTAGTMIEVPSAALRARQVLQRCDFASIGTNDLSQYLFAADRLEGRLADLLDPWQPALWDLARDVARAGRDLGKFVGMCGEASGDPLLALLAVGAGISSLSMAVSKVGLVRTSLSLHTLEQCEEMLDAAIASISPAESRAAVLELADREIAQLVGP